MTRRTFIPSSGVHLAVGLSIHTPSPRAEEPVSFVKDIQPIFEQSCWTCHSQTLQLSKLDLSSRGRRAQGGRARAVLVPGRADDSRLYRLVAGLEKPGMPLDGAPLTKEQIAAVKTWIDEGAHWDDRLRAAAPATPVNAGSALEHSPLPAGCSRLLGVQAAGAGAMPMAAAHLTNPIDRFLEKTRASKGLTAAPRADRLTLLRRRVPRPDRPAADS